MKKWFYFSDMQIPHEDKRAVDLAFNVMRWFKPNVVVNIGDLANGTGTSRWANGTTEEVVSDILEENSGVIDYWKRVKRHVPKARLIWAGGNHDKRPFEYADKKAPALREFITPESLWKISELGVEYYDYDLPPQIKMGDIWIHHGVAVSKHAGDSVRADMESYGVSIVRGHCFSDDTEILTSEGWKGYEDIDVDTEVYTINMNTGLGEYQNITDKFVYDWEEQMVSIKNPNLDILVTQDHKMVVYDNESLFNVPAKQMLSSDYELPLAAQNDDDDILISDSRIKFLAWFMAEGNFDSYKSSAGEVRYRLRLHQSDGPDGRMKRLTDILHECNLTPNWIKRYSGGTVQHGTYRNLDAYRTNILRGESLWVLDYLNPKDKTPLGDLLRLSSRQAKLFLMEYVWADGCKNSSAKNSYQLATNNIGIRDYLQKLCVVAGWRSSAIPRQNNMWCITFNTKGSTKVKSKNVSLVDYVGKVWCVSVPNHTLLVRRKGKTFFAGNSHRAGTFARTYELRDETLWGYEIGHLMDVTKADYSQVHNWQQAFAVGYENDGHGHIDIIPIHPGYVCYYGGKQFSLDIKPEIV